MRDPARVRPRSGFLKKNTMYSSGSSGGILELIEKMMRENFFLPIES
jgi:hypothetical protein